MLSIKLQNGVFLPKQKYIYILTKILGNVFSRLNQKTCFPVKTWNRFYAKTQKNSISCQHWKRVFSSIPENHVFLSKPKNMFSRQNQKKKKKFPPKFELHVFLSKLKKKYFPSKLEKYVFSSLENCVFPTKKCKLYFNENCVFPTKKMQIVYLR